MSLIAAVGTQSMYCAFCSTRGGMYGLPRVRDHPFVETIHEQARCLGFGPSCWAGY